MRDKVAPGSLCTQGYPCPHLQLSKCTGTCMFGRCQLTRKGDTVYDAISGRTTSWVTVERKRPRETIDPLDDWYDGFLERHGYRLLMESGNTYETRSGGIIKQTRTSRF